MLGDLKYSLSFENFTYENKKYLYSDISFLSFDELVNTKEFFKGRLIELSHTLETTIIFNKIAR
jgi:hypothetical protein